jgi:hypothetical protein
MDFASYNAKTASSDAKIWGCSFPLREIYIYSGENKY